MQKIKSFIIGIGIFTMIVGMFTFCNYIETHYNKTDCIVVSSRNNLITIEDKTGNLWDFKTEGNTIKQGTKVDLLMHTNNTNNIFYDDIIVDVKVQK